MSCEEVTCLGEVTCLTVSGREVTCLSVSGREVTCLTVRKSHASLQRGESKERKAAPVTV